MQYSYAPDIAEKTGKNDAKITPTNKTTRQRKKKKKKKKKKSRKKQKKMFFDAATQACQSEFKAKKKSILHANNCMQTKRAKCAHTQQHTQS
jgi:hypothetical protein